MKKLTLTLLLVGGIAGSAFGRYTCKKGRSCAKPCEQKRCETSCAKPCGIVQGENVVVEGKIPCCVEQMVIEKEVAPIVDTVLTRTYRCPVKQTCRQESGDYQVKTAPQMLHSNHHVKVEGDVVSDTIYDATGAKQVMIDSPNA